MTRTAATTIRPGPAVHEIRVGGAALFYEDGRFERVIVASAPYLHPERGLCRNVAFMERGGGEHPAECGGLVPCDDQFRADGMPEALRSPKSPRIDSAEHVDGGRVYAKGEDMEPKWGRADGARSSSARPPPITISPAALNPNQALRLDQALKKHEEARRMEAGRIRRDAAGNVVLRGRMSTEELTLRADAKALTDRIEAEIRASNEATETNAGLVRRLKVQREQALQDRRQELQDLVDEGMSEIVAAKLLSKFRSEMEAQDKNAMENAVSRPIVTRNGLDALLRSGAIDIMQHRAGERYAGLCEQAKAEMKVANMDALGGSSGGQRANTLAERNMEAKDDLKAADLWVQTHVRSPRACWSLKLVAGEGRCVAYFAGGGAGRAKTTEAVIDALDALTMKWGLK